jgi:hypothetical protein
MENKRYLNMNLPVKTGDHQVNPAVKQVLRITSDL